jgi:deazaflavin-dependent oxidoreductase (nitroreductase family)
VATHGGDQDVTVFYKSGDGVGAGGVGGRGVEAPESLCERLQARRVAGCEHRPRTPGHERASRSGQRKGEAMRRITTGQPAGRSDEFGLRHRVTDWLQKSVLNPLDKLAFALRIPPPGDALLETTGRHTGRPRVTPVCDGLQSDTFWIVAQQGHGADYVQNIQANPRVRVKGSLSRSGWRAGTAHVLDADDPEERVRTLSRTNRWRRLCLQASSAMGTSPLTVRVDLDPR